MDQASTPTPRRRLLQAALATAALGAASAPAQASVKPPEYLKYPKDPRNLAPGQETSHTPLFTVEKAERTGVAYGKTPVGDFYRVTVQARHESIADHYINRITLFLNNEQVVVYDMDEKLVETSLPVVTAVLRMKAGDVLLAVTDCNKHGQWANTFTA